MGRDRLTEELHRHGDQPTGDTNHGDTNHSETTAKRQPLFRCMSDPSKGIQVVGVIITPPT